jgi:hypothetical protein
MYFSDRRVPKPSVGRPIPPEHYELWERHLVLGFVHKLQTPPEPEKLTVGRALVALSLFATFGIFYVTLLRLQGLI